MGEVDRNNFIAVWTTFGEKGNQGKNERFGRFHFEYIAKMGCKINAAVKAKSICT